MERRNWSLEAFSKLKYIDSLEDERRAALLEKWVEKYIVNKGLKIFQSIENINKLHKIMIKHMPVS